MYDWGREKRIFQIRNLKKSLTQEELLDTIKFDWENASTIPDTSSYKLKFIKEKQMFYGVLDIEEQYQAWQNEEDRIKEKYPAIHKRSENE